MTAPAKALILDFGGVITRTMFETHAATELALGLPAGSLTWQGPFAPEADPLWQSMQAEQITEREYWQIRSGEVGKLVGKNWPAMSDFVQAARGDASEEIIRPEALATISAVKTAGYKLAILSNELDLFYGQSFRQKLSFLTDFDLIVDATYTQVLKPAPEAYLDCLQQLDLNPEQCVFVDDQMRNVVGARSVGLKTVAFDVRNPKQSYAEALNLMGLTNKETSHA
ncbi:MAG: HAD-IA family hydrolase [Alphaproteobacteria bacterium]|jgi:putative hydrolase of the HAD superfamily|nr:HAD-IA family hydrolase [Alphaproteobacteria bacterium]MBT4019341.1 HAD-IA family hydrolase [Alphaproteobacteria bacterium]MBT4966692.1 HAD-IA family hydrolase [Alphaproteobacteria bacterium]MBT5161943.1 HAD-IA family hydrolase [Alphaproteobacteria bacterium]MBT5919579.1 HAD-IA family hydrolase [Alphaproteobacteria bacterium]